jgi:hypothetical protein
VSMLAPSRRVASGALASVYATRHRRTHHYQHAPVLRGSTPRRARSHCLMVVCSRNVLSLTPASSVPKMERISPKKWLLSKRPRGTVSVRGSWNRQLYRVAEITTSPPNSFCPRPLLILARSGFLLFYPEGHRGSSAGGGRWVGASLPGRNARLTAPTMGTVHRERRPAPQGKIARRRIWQGNLPSALDRHDAAKLTRASRRS